MVRKSKQASGNAPLTHYERRHKLSTDHGTLERRLAGHAQYQLGECGLSLTQLTDAAGVLCSPSGYLYEDQAILKYLISQTEQIKEKQLKAQAAAARKVGNDEDDRDLAKRKASFEASQQLTKKKKLMPNAADMGSAREHLKRSSFWLAESQPDLVDAAVEAPVSACPLSPHSQKPLRRKDLWPIKLEYDDETKKLLCGLTGKPIRTQAAVAYWINRDQPGRVVLQDEGFNQLIVGAGCAKIDASKEKQKAKVEATYFCPCTNQKIKYIRNLQRSGSSFAASGQSTVVQQYRPTMT